MARALGRYFRFRFCSKRHLNRETSRGRAAVKLPFLSSTQVSIRPVSAILQPQDKAPNVLQSKIRVLDSGTDLALRKTLFNEQNSRSSRSTAIPGREIDCSIAPY